MQKNHKGLTLLKYMMPALIWAAGIFLVISIPGSSIPKSRFLNIENFDKVIHFSLFFVLCLLLCYGFFKQTAFLSVQKRYMLLAVIISIFYGALTEILQAVLLSSRHGNIWDFTANSAGAIIGAVAFGGLLKASLVKSNINKL